MGFWSNDDTNDIPLGDLFEAENLAESEQFQQEYEALDGAFADSIGVDKNSEAYRRGYASLGDDEGTIWI